MPENDAELKKRLEELKHLYGLEYEMIRATAAFEHAALRPLFLLNGGSLVVYMGLFGALGKAQQAGLDLSIGKYAVFLWIAGLLCAAVTAFFGARSQFAFRSHRGQQVLEMEIGLGIKAGSASEAATKSGTYAEKGKCSRQVAIVTGIVSILLFTIGFWPAFISISAAR